MSKSQHTAAIAAVIIPRAGRLPRDLATLLVTDPMTATARHLGGAKLAAKWAAQSTRNVVGPLIAAALADGRAPKA